MEADKIYTANGFCREKSYPNSTHSDEVFAVSINPNLSEDSRVMVLETPDVRVMAVLTPAMADKLALYQRKDCLSRPSARN